MNITNIVLLIYQIPVHARSDERDLAHAVLNVLGLTVSEIALQLNAGNMIWLQLESTSNASYPKWEVLVVLVFTIEPYRLVKRQQLTIASSHHAWIQAVHVENDSTFYHLSSKFRIAIGEATAVGSTYEIVSHLVDNGIYPAKILGTSTHALVIVKRIRPCRHLRQSLVQERLHDLRYNLNVTPNVILLF